MSIKILLISVNTYSNPYPVFPLGVSHLASYLKSEGYEVELYDFNTNDRNLLLKKIKKIQPDFIGLSLRNIDDVLIDEQEFLASALTETSKKIKEITDIPVILGGSGYSLFPKELLELSNADFGIIGEGEYPLSLFMKLYSYGEDVSNVEGLVYRTNGEIVVNDKAKHRLDTIPKPMREQSSVDFYIRKSTMLNIQTQRGCPFRCCYCTYPVIEGRTLRKRSAELVCDDIEDAVSKGAKYLFFTDSVFNTTSTHASEICEEIIKRNIKVDWGCFLRPKNITKELMMLMAKAGLKHIEFGSDSLADATLEAYGKNFTFEDIYNSSEAARLAEVYYAHFLIAGGPRETRETLIEGFENSKRLKKTVFFPYIGMRIYPNTDLYDTAVSEGVISKEQNLLKPAYYVTPNLSVKEIEEILTNFTNEKRNWRFGSDAFSEKEEEIQQRLRDMGVVGPLWEFIVS